MQTIHKERTRRPHPMLYTDAQYASVEVFLLISETESSIESLILVNLKFYM